MVENDVVTLCAVGDVGPDREDPDSIFQFSAETTRGADIAFCQLERSLTKGGSRQVQIRSHHSRVDPKNVSALVSGGFNVVSFASNHTLDWGVEGLFDTMELLKAKGMHVIGVGRDIEEARRPVVIEKKGVKIAFLGYCSVLPKGYDAAPGVAGCAPLRATTFYEQVDWQAGTPPKIVTNTNQNDLNDMIKDIQKIRPLVDIVIVSVHWGIHFAPAMIAMYQREAGHAAIDAGADLILGHHAHILKGIEVYKGKTIFYSLGNFAFDVPASFVLSDPGYRQMRQRYPWDVDPGYTGYGYPVDSRKTMIVRCLISRKGIEKVSFLPALINKDAEPEILRVGDGRFKDVVDYLSSVSKIEKLESRLTTSGDEVVVS